MITVVGIGPGAKSLLTQQAQQVIENADWIYGSQRQLDALHLSDERALSYEDINGLIQALKRHEGESAVVLASGDPLVYGIGSALRRYFDQVEVVCGISTLHYLFSKIDQDMNDCYFTSAHGRAPDYDLWFKMPKLAAVTDKVYGPSAIAKAYAEAGMNVVIYVGTALSYPEEAIVSGAAADIQNQSFDGLSVVVIVHER